MKTKGKDHMTDLELEVRNFTDKKGDNYLFYKIDGAYFAFQKVVAKQAIGRALGMSGDEIKSYNTRQIGDRFWSGGKGNGGSGKAGPRKADKTVSMHSHAD